MTEKTQKKIWIKWARSGIGFSYRVKGMVRSLGLRRLNQVVERPDTPPVRGLVARIPHLVEVVDEPPTSVWGSLPEYTISPGEAAPVSKRPAARVEAEVAEGERVSAVPAKVREPAASAGRERKRERPAEEPAAASKGAKKPPKGARLEKGKTAKAVESKKKQKPAPSKRGKTTVKGKK